MPNFENTPRTITSTEQYGSIEDGGRRVVCGYAKTGRTWMRYMLAHALVKERKLDIDVDLTNIYSIVPNDEAGLVPGQSKFEYEGIIPKVEMSHRAYDETFKDSNRVFLTRDPRDVLVSHWLHYKNQIHQFDGDLSEFVASDQGIDSFLTHLESWAPELDEEQILTYESMRTDPTSSLATVALRLCIPLSPSSIEYAITEGDMKRMRKKEVQKGIAGHTYDRSNPEALRVRRGKVGGFVDYLRPADEAYIHSKVSRTSPEAKDIIALTGYPLSMDD